MATDFFAQCGGPLASVNRARNAVENTESLIAGLQDQLESAFAEIEEECAELADDFDDVLDTLAEILKGFAVFPLVGNAIEIFQCTSALGEWERIGHEIEVFEDRLEREQADLDEAQEGLDECAHKWATEQD
jgi:flagellar motility protein MotE (MotC chaperone)